MKVERLLQLHIVMLVVVSSSLLGVIQKDSFLPFIGVFAAATSIYFTDIHGWLQFNRFLANAAAMLALVVCCRDFFQNANATQLEAISRLLVYLQIVLFYQEKNPRIYWQLTILSLLQVVVAAAMNVGLEFGLLLFAYMLVAFSTLVVFLFHRELEHDPNARFDLASLVPWLRRGRYAGKTPVRVTVTKRRNPTVEHFIRWGLPRQVAALGISTVLFTTLLFYSVPRLQSQPKRKLQRGKGQVGFSDRVWFKEMGEILQNRTPALRVTFRDPVTRKPQQVSGDPYLRGAVLVEYIQSRSREGGWRTRESGDFVHGSRLLRPFVVPNYDGQQGLIQDCEFLSGSDRLLFASYPIRSLPESTGTLKYSPGTGHLTRSRRGSKRNLYSVATYAFNQVTQTPLFAHELSGHPQWSDIYLEERRRLSLLTTDQRARLAGLIRLADEILETDERFTTSRPRETDVVRQARALQNHFRFSGKYTYTLNMDSIGELRNTELDAMEDFVLNHRRGHCQYFASALALMLRSQGIPARLAVGFHGGEYNAVGGYYEVAHGTAHAWVEALVSAEAAKPYLTTEQSESNAQAYWLRLDPTPASELGSSQQDSPGLFSTVDQAFDYAQLLWQEYVVTMHPDSNADNLGENDQKLPRSALSQYLVNAMPQLTRWGILLVTGLFVGILGLVNAWPRLHQRFLRSATSDDAQSGSGHGLSAYYQLEHRLAQQGLSRAASQTQREFITELVHLLEAPDDDSKAGPMAENLDQPGHQQLADSGQVIVESFYKQRFGSKRLPEGEQEELEHACQVVWAAMTSRRTPAKNDNAVESPGDAAK